MSRNDSERWRPTFIASNSVFLTISFLKEGERKKILKQLRETTAIREVITIKRRKLLLLMYHLQLFFIKNGCCWTEFTYYKTTPYKNKKKTPFVRFPLITILKALLTMAELITMGHITMHCAS
jgi:hypothetical protein